jgi:hypothetical protein
MADDSDIVNKDDMNSNTNVFYDQQLLAMKLADVFNSDVKKKLKTVPKKKYIFPTTDTIYSKDIVMEQEGNYKYYGNYNAAGNKYKKQYDGYYDYNGNNSKYDKYNDYYGHEEEDNCDNNLVREHSEKLKLNNDGYFEDKVGSKFISKSKSPILNKKIAFSDINNKSLSPTNQISKINLDGDNKDKEKTLNNITPFNDNKKKLYCIRDKSRFDFVKNIENNADKDVPEFVCDVICKKFSRHSFFNKFTSQFEKNFNDCIYFEKELKEDNSWSQFIITNLENK